MNDAVVTEDIGRVRVIKMNRPDALNSMNPWMFMGIRDALHGAQEDDTVAVAVITGEGRAFCAGLDLADSNSPDPDAPKENQFPSMLKALTEFRKPLIAAVNGLGVGVGMTMLAHCDLVLMAKSVKMRTPFPQLGLAPEAGSSFSFAERMGWQNASYALLSGRWFSAQECLDMGLAWRVEADEEVLGKSMEVAEELAKNPIPSLIATKELMMMAGRQEASWSAHGRENEVYADLMGGPANREAFKAFAEKRDPDFSKISGI